MPFHSIAKDRESVFTGRHGASGLDLVYVLSLEQSLGTNQHARQVFVVVGFSFTWNHVSVMIDGLESNFALPLHKKATSTPIQLNRSFELSPAAWFHQM